MGKYFGTDGVRGRANDTLTPELAYALGRAAATVLALERHMGRPLLLIGKDTRISGDMLEAALAAGITAAGCDVLLLGVIPTPGVAVLTRTMGAAAGAVISASHNPYYDNGIKFFSSDGFKLPDVTEEAIEKLIDAPKAIPRLYDDELGIIRTCPDAAAQYRTWLHQQVKTDLRGLRLVVDTANGAATPIAAETFRLLGAEVSMIGNSPNGLNINAGCGSTHMEALCARVAAEGADLGLAFDGDTDRLLAVDENGALVDGDQIITILAKYLKEKGALAKNSVVITVMSNLGMRQALKELGIHFQETQVGDRYVLERMLGQGISLGGEQSGHIILSNYNTTGDGLLSALMLLTVVKRSGKRLSELARIMNRLPQVLVNVRVSNQEGWETDPDILAAKEEAETRLADSGRLLLRASGTEPLLRVMAEGNDEDELREIVGQVADVIRRKLG